MGHHYCHLDMAERVQIMRLLERKIPVSQIAKIIGRHVSTLYRELRRSPTISTDDCRRGIENLVSALFQ